MNRTVWITTYKLISLPIIQDSSVCGTRMCFWPTERVSGVLSAESRAESAGFSLRAFRRTASIRRMFGMGRPSSSLLVGQEQPCPADSRCCCAFECQALPSSGRCVQYLRVWLKVRLSSRLVILAILSTRPWFRPAWYVNFGVFQLTKNDSLARVSAPKIKYANYLRSVRSL